jgi:hypothetical protein
MCKAKGVSIKMIIEGAEFVDAGLARLFRSKPMISP